MQNTFASQRSVLLFHIESRCCRWLWNKQNFKFITICICICGLLFRTLSFFSLFLFSVVLIHLCTVCGAVQFSFCAVNSTTLPFANHLQPCPTHVWTILLPSTSTWLWSALLPVHFRHLIANDRLFCGALKHTRPTLVCWRPTSAMWWSIRAMWSSRRLVGANGAVQQTLKRWYVVHLHTTTLSVPLQHVSALCNVFWIYFVGFFWFLAAIRRAQRPNSPTSVCHIVGIGVWCFRARSCGACAFNVWLGTRALLHPRASIMYYWCISQCMIVDRFVFPDNFFFLCCSHRLLFHHTRIVL